MQTTATQTPAPSKPFVTAIRQVGLVTGDLNSTLRELANRFGIGPFNCWHLASRQLFGRKFRGAPVPWTINLAIAWVGQMQLEVIQPLTGPSSLAEYLNSTGEGGIPPLLVATGNLKLAPAIRRFKSLGCPVDLEGYANLPAQIGPLTILPIPKFAAQRLNTHFAYLNTQHIAGTTLEVSQLPPLMPFRVGMSIAKPQYRIPLPGPNRLVKEINKVGIITPNLDRLLSSYTHQLGIGPWRITTLD